MIWVRWFPGDYLRDTTHLSLLEDGAYRRLLDLYYTNSRALTTDRERLYRQLRITDEAEKEAVENVLKEFFFERNGNLYNSRASKELRNARDYQLRQVNAGKARAKQAAAAQPRLSGGSASTSTSTTTKNKTPLPPVVTGGLTHNVLPGGSRNGLQYVERYGQLVEVTMGRHRRLPNLDSTAGMHAEYLVQWFEHRGFVARILDRESL